MSDALYKRHKKEFLLVNLILRLLTIIYNNITSFSSSFVILKRYNSTLDTTKVSGRKINSSSILTSTLNKIEGMLVQNDWKVNEEIQKNIELLSMNEFDMSKQYLADINSMSLNPTVSKYVLDKYDKIDIYINNLFPSNEAKSKKDFMTEILNKVDRVYIKDLCVHTFFKVLTFQNTDSRKLEDINLVSCCIRLGKKITQKDLRQLLMDYRKQNLNKGITYSEWLEEWKNKNKKFSKSMEGDEIYAELGAKVVEILESS